MKPSTTPPPPKDTKNHPRADLRFTLPERIAACELLWRLIIQTH